ncbi:MAG: phosphoglycerate kinase [Parachlamydiaceae bacterium]|nr:phosphoglycerate kinase [Parachlamydiaceae bacterium]
MEKLSIKDVDLNGKKVLIRVDFNVPLEKGKIIDDTRIRASIPTIQYALDHGAAVILMSHLGRPNGKRSQDFSLKPCAKHLSDLIKKPVIMASDCIGPEVEKIAKSLQPGDILMLENLRFHKGEEHPLEEPGLANSLSMLGDIYVDDAFGCAHRSHASITSLAQFFPGKAAAGLLMEKEIAYLGTHLMNPTRPFCALLGGAKISTKFKVIEALMHKADVLLIGGAMANTFFKAEEIPIGNSLFEPDFITVARQILDVSTQSKARIILPIDVVIARKIDSDKDVRIIDIKTGVPEGFQIVDIGPKTVQKFSDELKQAETIFWNGPVGVYEFPTFAKGTKAIAQTLANMDATTIVGGGDSIAALEESGLANQISHISTGGGASLEFIELGTLPGIEVLTNKK